jgi:hypothetical protein
VTRKQLTQKKKRFASTGQQKEPPEQKSVWSRSDILTLIGIIIATIGLLCSLTIPEVRQFVGLDHPAQTSKSLRLHYPQLWLYYDGNQQVYSGQQAAQGKNATSMALNFLWQTPVEGTEGRFVGNITFESFVLASCHLHGSMSPLNLTTSYADITFICTFQSNSNEVFEGEIYPDSHISGIVTDPRNPIFSATWHFSAPKYYPIPNPDTPPRVNGYVDSGGTLSIAKNQPAPICNSANC